MKTLILGLLLAAQAPAPPPPTVYVQPFNDKTAMATAANSVTPFGMVLPWSVDSAEIVRKRMAKKCPAVRMVLTPAEATLRIVFIEKGGHEHGATLLRLDGTVVYQTTHPAEWSIAKDICAYIQANP